MREREREIDDMKTTTIFFVGGINERIKYISINFTVFICWYCPWCLILLFFFTPVTTKIKQIHPLKKKDDYCSFVTINKCFCCWTHNPEKIYIYNSFVVVFNECLLDKQIQSHESHLSLYSYGSFSFLPLFFYFSLFVLLQT